MVDRGTIQEVRSRVKLAEFVAEYIPLRLAQKGKGKGASTRYVARCPFCVDHGEQFTVSDELGLYFCFECKMSGDVVRFVQVVEGASFDGAVRLLGKRVGVHVEAPRDPTRNPFDEHPHGHPDTLTDTWFGDDHRGRPTQWNPRVRDRWRFRCVAPGSYQRVTDLGRPVGEPYDRNAALAAIVSCLIHDGRDHDDYDRWRMRREAAEDATRRAFAARMIRAVVRRAIARAAWALDFADARAGAGL